MVNRRSHRDLIGTLVAMACALVLLWAPVADAQDGSTAPPATQPTDAPAAPAATSPPSSVEAGNGAVITSDSPTVSADPVEAVPDDSSTASLLVVVAISLVVAAATVGIVALRRRAAPGGS